MTNPKIGKLVSVKKNPFYDVRIKSFDIQMGLSPWLDSDIILAAKKEAGDRCGWFKLQSSEWMEPAAALETYRHRVGTEHPISSIRSVVDLKPLRVWKKASVRGSLLLAPIAQLMISMVRYDLEPDLIEKMEDGKRAVVEHKPSQRTIVENLLHWTVTVIPRDGWKTERIFSNETELTRRISAVLERYRGCFRRIRRSRIPIKH